jgi:DNA-binding CsgD family transcriptional regulator
LDQLEQATHAIQANLTETPDISTAMFHLFRGGVRLHRGDFAGAEQDTQRAVEIAHQFGAVTLVMGSMTTAYIILAVIRSDWATMDSWTINGADESKHGQIARNWRLHFLQFQARARWHAGNIDGLRQTYELAMTPSPFDTPPAAASYRSIVRGIMRLAERQYAQAEQAFRDAVREEDGFKITRAVASGRVLLAYTLLTRGRSDEAMEVFTPYFAESEQWNLAGRVMHHNPYIQPLLRCAHERNIQRPFAEKILEMLGAPLNAMEAAGGEALSEREMEVLRVMAEGLGNKEIGARLFVSEATVKTHVQRILRKLDAATRTQAVTRARELMLI